MVSIQNNSFQITCREDGRELSLLDRQRGVRWLLDEQTVVYHGVSTSPWGGYDTPPRPMRPHSARIAEDGKLAVTYLAGDLPLEITFRLEKEYIEVILDGASETLSNKNNLAGGAPIGAVSLPGCFSPEGEHMRLLLPIMQGMLWDGRGPAFNQYRPEGSHTGFSLAFSGCLGQKGGLLLTAETRDDHLWWLGKAEDGRFWCANLQTASLGSLRYPRSAHLYTTDPDIVSLAKTYRRKVIAQGRFKSWQEKIAERPAVARLFGALMCYIGYCEDLDGGQLFDYLANFRKLKDYGFERALVYPVRFNIYHPDIRMGGVPAIHLSPETVNAVKDLGYDIAPWSWLNEALDTGPGIQAIYRRTPAGQPIKHWAIDDQQWYLACCSAIPGYQRRALQESLAAMTWDHFDVLACVPPMECYALDHPGHPGQPLSRSADRQAVRQAFLSDQQAGLVVSSENFNDAYSLECDLGSVKAWPQYGPWPFWPVPLTMLVYHDSMIHSWWEVHSYNTRFFGRTQAPGPFCEYGGGRPRLMAALDALMGCPPDVFPFGAQYAYSGRGKETFLFKHRFEDPETQTALREALPVARLHQRTGMQELVHFRILSEDGYLQESAFAGGTHVVANFSQEFRLGPDNLPVPPEGWRVVE
jgi:hypothetical protein